MSDIAKLPIEEFRRLGFVQELNRRFLHPHGLALEVAVPEGAADGGEVYLVPLMPDAVEVLRTLAKLALALAAEKEAEGLTVDGAIVTVSQIEDLVRGLDELPEPVTEWLSGIWDYRDDPEGIWYGGNLTATEKARAGALDEIWQLRRPYRQAKLGFMIEPV